MTTRKIEQGRTLIEADALANLTEPTEIYVSRGPKTEALYKAEEKRSEAIKTCATLWAKAFDLDAEDKAVYWGRLIPQALFDALESFSAGPAIVAAEGFLKQFGWKVQRPGDQPVTGDPAELWEEYLAELDGGEPSPQGAMAFAFAKLTGTSGD